MLREQNSRYDGHKRLGFFADGACEKVAFGNRDSSAVCEKARSALSGQPSASDQPLALRPETERVITYKSFNIDNFLSMLFG
jgi:hypothetical protein